MKERILSASKAIPSDLVLVNAIIADVFTQSFHCADLAIKDGVFVGIGNYKGFGSIEIDCSGKYIIPGFIDAHVHIESTLVTPLEYSYVSLIHGVTSVIADPHEIANVAGIAGIEFMMKNAALAPLDIYFMLSSCVPATSFENSGAILKAADLRPLYKHRNVTGLAEVMDFPAVFSAESDMLQKLEDADQKGLIIDGHAPGFNIDQLNIYAAAQIRTDHECDTGEGLCNRLSRGIYTLIREGTVCRDLLRLVPYINEKNSRLCCFCTDDKHLDDLMSDGGLDHNVRMAIKSGLNPATAIQIASLNAATCYNLRQKGAIAPGYIADFSIVKDLEQLEIEKVFKNGVLLAENQKILDRKILDRIDTESIKPGQELLTSMNFPDISVSDFLIKMGQSSQANIIEISEGSVITKHIIEDVDVEDGLFQINVDKDQLKITVVERHKNLGNIKSGIIKGLKLKQGAIATSIAHDSHNLIAVGTNDSDILYAIQSIKKMQGGIVIVNQEKVLSSLRLEIAGLISTRKAEQVISDLDHLRKTIKTIAPECDFNPFLTLSFMSLIVIPDIKICDSGLFDVKTFNFLDVPVM